MKYLVIALLVSGCGGSAEVSQESTQTQGQVQVCEDCYQYMSESELEVLGETDSQVSLEDCLAVLDCR